MEIEDGPSVDGAVGRGPASDAIDLTDLATSAQLLREHHPAKAIVRVLAEARERLGMEVAFVSQFDGGRRIFRYLNGDVFSVGIAVDEGGPMDEAYCARVIAGQVPMLIRDAQTEPSVADLVDTKRLNIGAHVSVPIVFSDGHVYGTFCCFSRRPDMSLDERDIDMMKLLASLVADQLEAENMRERKRELAAGKVRSILQDGSIRTVVQPVVSLSDQSVSFVEALARFDVPPSRSPDQWFSDGWTSGFGVELELAAVRAAVRNCEHLPPRVKLSFNISPETALSDELIKCFETVDATRLIVEVTEHSEVLDYIPLKRALLDLRSIGVALAVDDVGAGHSGLNRLLELEPEILKLDLSITTGIHHDQIRRALAAAIASFARSNGLLTVAEGIESVKEIEALRDLGIDLGQGFHFSRPVPIRELYG